MAARKPAPTAPAITLDGAKWEDAYWLRTDKKAVHLVPEPTAEWSLCDRKINRSSRPFADSVVCPNCVKQAHRPHRDHIAKEEKNRKRRGCTPGPGQTDITGGVL